MPIYSSKLQKQIDDHYYSTNPSFLDMQDVEATKKRLEIALRPYLEADRSEWSLVLYGSSVNGLYTKEKSDIDMSLIFKTNIYKGHKAQLRNIEEMLKTDYQQSYS